MEPVDPVVSGKGQDKPSQSLYLSPSSKGRQRKKNPKYLDEPDFTENVKQKSPRKSPEKCVPPKKTPAKPRKTKTPPTETANGEKEQIPPDTVEQTLVTPKRRGRSKKTPLVKTASPSLTVTADGDPQTTETGGAENSVKQENGTPKPKRKYVRKKPVEEVRDPPDKKEQGEPDEEPESGGRRRRGAAKVALKYLHDLAKEAFAHSRDEPDSEQQEESQKKGSKKGRKRKRDDIDALDDEDFVPNIVDEEEDEADEGDQEEEEFWDEERDGRRFPSAFYSSKGRGKPIKGIPNNIIQTMTDSAEKTRKFREEHCSSWVFPDWVPSAKDWEPVPENELEKYLPQEVKSAAFKVTREGLTKEEAPQLRLSRFEATPAHRDRWDMILFAGGPVWAMEWCPTPDGAPASQYLALACHRGMDDLHCVNRTYSEPGLLQLWDCGKLEYDSRPNSQPSLAYGLAQDKGFIWQLKWCPAGGWELPNCVRKAFLPRLGLLAAATSSGVVTIYSLPHPEALLLNRKLSNSESNAEIPPIYKARDVVTLKLGGIKSPRKERSGQVLSMDWLPQKPHNIVAVGFYDGLVGLWDLSTKSSLLRVRESDRSMTLLPYRCILAHEHAVRSLVFCPASRFLLTTAGEDRYLKTWDLRRICDPVKTQKRCLSTEICWPLDAPGILSAQESAFVPKHSIGVHYLNHCAPSYFPIPRGISVWALSHSDWLNSVLSSDVHGGVILSMLPPTTSGQTYIKRTHLRRFPAYFTSLVPFEATAGKNKGRKDGGAVSDGQETGETEKSEAGRTNGEENDGATVRTDASPQLQFGTYKEAVKKYYLHYKDFDMESLAGLEKRTLWKHMDGPELRAESIDEMPLAALFKARFNPNMSNNVWVASGGQSGLVRLHCVRTFITPQFEKMTRNHQVHFRTLFSGQNQGDGVKKEQL
ncbi:general transcription factor 3C polypeptide 2 [Cyprinodon tularosa]|uniref:general transcription factor 3C polypeptide 2 n=1 Tax=Cyprinodon tularosa TaxID=77115 RepID=UPI0018E27A3F|nr:general transcription factor 3C polypeptide 2 [Cyprinodon tularosa]